MASVEVAPALLRVAVAGEIGVLLEHAGYAWARKGLYSKAKGTCALCGGSMADPAYGEDSECRVEGDERCWAREGTVLLLLEPKLSLLHPSPCCSRGLGGLWGRAPLLPSHPSSRRAALTLQLLYWHQ